jgi:DNA-binding NarL/FixJ family response regulator
MAKVRVVIADDHRLFVEALDVILSTDGRVEVVGHAYDGQEAVELVRNHKPEVVLMDIAMPRLDGIDATKAILEAGVGTRVIVLTGSDSTTDVARARAAGAAGFVTKDQIAGDLLRAILDAVER